MKRKFLTIKNVLIAICALGLATIATVTATMIAGLSTSKASITLEDTTVSASYGRFFVGGNSNGTSQTNAQALFGKNGINLDTAVALMNVIDTVRPSGTDNKTAADFSAFVEGKTEKDQGAVYVRLFEPMTGTSNAAYFTTSKAEAEGETGKARWWRIVHLQGDVLTLWMAEPYRNSTKFGDNNTYQGSTVQSELLADFTSVYSNYNQDGKTAIDSTIVTTTPYSIVSQTGSGAGTADYYTNPTVSDKVWLPTGYEIFNTANNTTNDNTSSNYTTTRAGYWQVNGIDRAYNYSAGSVYSYAWLRSARSSNTTSAGVVSCNGSRNGIGGSNGCAVRPALHINLAGVSTSPPSSIVAEIE